MKHCKRCGAEISKSAKFCPKCGQSYGIPTFVKFLIILFIVFGLLIGCVAACTKGLGDAIDDAVKETKDAYKDKNGKTEFGLNESFENKYEKITLIDVNSNFTDHSQYSKPSSGKKYVMVKFEVENTSGEKDEIYVSSLSFNGYADGVAVNTSYVGNDKYSDLSATVGKGKKTVGYIFYEIPTNTKEFIIEYNADFWSDGTVIKFNVIK